MARPKKNKDTHIGNEMSIGAPVSREVVECECVSAPSSVLPKQKKATVVEIVETLQMIVDALYEITGDMQRCKPISDKLDELKKRL